MAAPPKGPITIQVSPSTYLLMLKMIELGVEYDTTTKGLQLDKTKAASLQPLLDALYAVLTAGSTTTVADLKQLQDDGLKEASDINKDAGYQVVMQC